MPFMHHCHNRIGIRSQLIHCHHLSNLMIISQTSSHSNLNSKNMLSSEQQSFVVLNDLLKFNRWIEKNSIHESFVMPI